MSIPAKLGASLVMPPPSQANTLRKTAVCQDVTVAGRAEKIIIILETKIFSHFSLHIQP